MTRLRCNGFNEMASDTEITASFCPMTRLQCNGFNEMASHTEINVCVCVCVCVCVFVVLPYDTPAVQWFQ